MTDIPDHKNMSVVLVVCSPAHVERGESVQSQPTVEPSQTVETVSIAQTSTLTPRPVPVSAHQRLDHVVRDILARGGYGSIEVGYCRNGSPSMEEAIEHAVARRAGRIVVVPTIFTLPHSLPCKYCVDVSLNDLRQRVAEVQAQHPDANIVCASRRFDHERQVDLILSKIREYEPEIFKAGTLHLSDLATGETGVVRELDGGAHFRSRMASLGFTLGVRVKMMQNYGHGAIIVSLRGARVALGRGEARKVGIARRADQGQPGF